MVSSFLSWITYKIMNLCYCKNKYKNNKNNKNKNNKDKNNKDNKDILQKHYEKGDFSFIEDSYFRYTLEYDYEALNKIGIEAWDLLRFNNFRHTFRDGERRNFELDRDYNLDKNLDNHLKINNISNIWDTPPGISWMNIKNSLSKTHTEYTFNRNIKILSYIAMYGWQGYVLNHKLKHMVI